MFGYSFLADPPLLYYNGNGEVTLEELVLVVDEARSDPRCIPAIAALLDLRGVRIRPQAAAEVSPLARRLRERTQGRRGSRAAVVADSDLTFGLCRMMQSYRGENRDPVLNIVRSLDEAIAWLELDPDLDLPARPAIVVGDPVG